MCAAPLDQPIGTGSVPVQHEIFAEQAHSLDRPLVQLRHRANGLPVTAQELPHGSPRADLGQRLVLGFGEHASLLQLDQRNFAGEGSTVVGVPNLLRLLNPVRPLWQHDRGAADPVELRVVQVRGHFALVAEGASGIE